jgi:hypothetical protein
MANSHKNFLAYLTELNLTSTQEDRLRTSRDALVNRIEDDFRKKDRLQPDDESQGSYALETQNRPIDENFDLDHGIYLKHYKDSEEPTPKEAQDLVKEAVDGHTDQPLGKKDACVRVVYAKNGDTPTHHIDLAVYRVKSDGTKLYAHLKEGWQKSDQSGFKTWFKNNKSEQLQHLVRYFKGWADNNNGDNDRKLPSGFHLTVLTIQCGRSVQERDDQAFIDTAAAISDRLKRGYQWGTGDKVNRPVTPGEDLFKNYPAPRLNSCIEQFDKLVAEGRKALAEADPVKAQRIWQEIFGERFDVIEETKEDSGSYEKHPDIVIARSRGSG